MSLQKKICHVEDVIPRIQVVDSMPTLVDIEKIPPPSDILARGKTSIQNFMRLLPSYQIADTFSFHYSLDSKASKIEKMIMPLEKLERTTEQSSQTGAIESDAPLILLCSR